MRNAINSARCSVCGCDHRAPAPRTIRSVEFNRDLARKISDLKLSGDATVDLVLTELLDCRSGRLFDPYGKPIVLDTDNAAEVAQWDGLFSEDQRRFVNRYKERATGAFNNRLQERLIFPVAMMYLAITVRQCRHSSRCARS